MCTEHFMILTTAGVYRLEVGQYIENIVDISPISIYRYRIGTVDIDFFRYIYIVSVKGEISEIF